MTAMLSSKELANIYTKLQAPVIVADLLDRGTPLNDDESFALMIMLSEMQPAEALISIACCTQIIASRIEVDASLTTSLKLQSDFILDDYGPHWLQQQARRDQQHDAAAWSVYMQEDLEAMSDLLMLAADIFGAESVAAAEICTILQDQAMAQAEALDSETLPDEHYDEQMQEQAPAPQLVYGDNVIPFPSLRRN